MQKIILWFTVICLFAFSLILMLGKSTVTAGEIEKISGMKFVQLVRGGLLYDNWLSELKVEIRRTHPSYPDVGKKEGAATWRCKECHGWDYKGRVGTYSKGSHYTGILGIRSYANINPSEIVKILKDDTHAFGNMLSENDYDALSLFVSVGQIDADLYIDREDKKSIGDEANGGRIFLATCVKCHGVDGKKINFKDEKTPEYIGTVSNSDPWEVLHKIRWGHPGTQMISLIFLHLKEQLDVLAFCQTLPTR